jgi:hypothetical protein
MGGLESALARPQTGYYRDPIEEGAALWMRFDELDAWLRQNVVAD